MKKLFKALIVTLAISCCEACALAFTACGSKSKVYTGEYSYTSHNTNYGVKVNVTVEEDVIKKVEIVDSDYVVATPAGWANLSKWEAGLDQLLKSYEGKTVSEIKAINVACTDKVPNKGQDCSGHVIADATQGSGRLLLAIQDALK